jgi:hypothetical protein
MGGRFHRNTQVIMRRKKIAFILIFTLTLTIGCYRSDLFNGTLDQVSLLNINSSEMHFAGGDGSAGNPYQVATPAQLNNVRNYPDAHFIQTADIDLNVAPYNSGTGWEPIGSSGLPFIGTYDGASHKISNLFINRSAQNYIGLFGLADGAIINNIAIDGASVAGNQYVGALLGYNSNGSTRIPSTPAAPSPLIQNCSVINGNITGTTSVGGLVGHNYGSGNNLYWSMIDQSFAIGTVTVSGNMAGGMVGSSAYYAKISMSFANTVVTGDQYVGGLVGHPYYSGTIENCYAVGSVTAISTDVGGLAGIAESNPNTITYSYAACAVSGAAPIGGLVGSTGAGAVTTSYYDSDVSGQNDTGRGCQKR